MCLYDAQQHGADPLPGPEDGWCGKSRVGALTASVMAALATVDGIVCTSSIPAITALRHVQSQSLITNLPEF
jgi:hypothetical protein